MKETQLMNEPEIQEFLKQHWAVLSELYRSIEEGIAESRTFFEDKDKAPDPWLYAHIVRMRICWNLSELADGNLQFEQTVLPMSGVEIKYRKDIVIKVLKADGGEMPAPGRSPRRQEFYNRNLFGTDLEVFDLPSWALLWDTDGEIKLVFPKDAQQPWKAGSQRMSIVLPHPGEVDWLEPESVENSEDHDLSELTDSHNLDIAAAEEKD